MEINKDNFENSMIVDHIEGDIWRAIRSAPGANDDQPEHLARVVLALTNVVVTLSEIMTKHLEQKFTTKQVLALMHQIHQKDLENAKI